MSIKICSLRFFIKLAYNGTKYNGWQIQPNAPSVQSALNKALSVILNSDINVMGAGRTDTGVHAKEMYAHFDIDKEIDIHNTVHKLNSFLPKDIVIYDIISVDSNAHCRFDAKKRTYQYHINTTKNIFCQDGSWYYPKKLDINLMNEAAKLLLQHNDFQTFSKVHTDVKTFNCCVSEAFWKEENEQLIFTITADRFLRNMVRAIVGTLINVGLNKITVKDFNSIIESKKRTEAGFSVPAQGLYLTAIQYEYL